MLYGLDLFSGIGGISLALSEWVRTVAYCENDRYAQGVLLSRMVDGSLPRAPIWDDVATLKGDMLPRGIDIIFGGFPCQDISLANNFRTGLDGERSGLISEVWRLVDEIRPRYIFLENVSAIVNAGLDRILSALAERGFDARWMCLSAADVGACHRRNRWWLLAHANIERSRERRRKAGSVLAQTALCSCVQADAGCTCENRNTAHTAVKRLEGWNGATVREPAGQRDIEQSSSPALQRVGWPTVAGVCRTDDGIQNRVDRIKCLGNSVVPQCAREAFAILMNVK